jgi:hypothetical protein
MLPAFVPREVLWQCYDCWAFTRPMDMRTIVENERTAFVHLRSVCESCYQKWKASLPKDEPKVLKWQTDGF